MSSGAIVNYQNIGSCCEKSIYGTDFFFLQNIIGVAYGNVVPFLFCIIMS